MSSENLNLCEDVFAVIVTFNPDITILTELLDSLMSQVGRGVIVDNSSSIDMVKWHSNAGYDNLGIYRLEENYGIAYAQNIGINFARSSSANYVLLSDQDSRPEKNMVSELRNGAIKLITRGVKLAAVGPNFVEPRLEKKSPFIRTQGFTVNKQTEANSKNLVEVDNLIASGCLIPIHVFDIVGLMNKDLFIDYVDVEWGFRANYYGFLSYGIFSAKMNHAIGDLHVNVFGKKIPLHSPIRHYYIMRNGLWLYKQKYIPINWKLIDAYRLIIYFLLYTIFAKPRHKHFFMMLRGIADGFRSKMGPY